jgi:hypothetical protein
MHFSRRRWIPAVALLAGALATACGSDNPAEPPVAVTPTNLTINSTGATSANITFQGHAGDDSYIIERATGATGGTFTSIATPAAPASGTTVSVDDNALSANTTYRYRVSAVRGSSTSAPTAEVSVTTGLGTVNVTQDVTASTTWTADNVYVLKGFIHVLNGATLTIEAGTTIKGDYNTLGSSLFIMRGAKIMAVGTANAPIVFTSSQPAGQRKPGDWGGLIIIGNATINRTGTIDIEGTGTVTGTTSGTNYTVSYSGGTTDTDDSGELKYVRVEYAGYAPSNGNELNAFTFAAIGSGTKLSYLQALAGLDDSFEFFGGTVDADHLVSYESGDDNFDMSEGFRGRLQYLISFNSTQLAQRQGAGTPASDPEGIENDGCAGTGCAVDTYNSQPYTIPVVANFTMVGTGSTASSGSSGGIGMVLRRGVGGYYVNGIIARYPRFGLAVRDAETYARAGSVATPDLATADLAVRNVLFVEVPTLFDPSGATFDLAGNSIVNNTTATTGSLFTAFPATATTSTTEAAFDWTPAASSPAATGGLATFTGKLATKTATATPTGNTVAGTDYLGAAAPGGPKWWQGWTKYAQQ